MSLFCSIDKSTSGSIIHKVASCQFFATFSLLQNTSKLHNKHITAHRRFSHSFTTESAYLGTWFVDALVAAGKCKQHASRIKSLETSNGIQQRQPRPTLGHRLKRAVAEHRKRHISNAAHAFSEPSTKEELLALIDQYDSELVTDVLPLLELPSLQQPESSPHPFVSDKLEDYERPYPPYRWPAQGQTRKAIEALEQALKDPEVCPEYVYRLYRELPAPRVPYLDPGVRHKVLRSLGLLERKDEDAMLRYLSVVDDMKATGIPLTSVEWNWATSFAGRYVGRTTELEVEAGLRIWKEMEHVAGIRANAATFNILFDMATKAGKFKLAEMIYTEMADRGFAFNRFHHVSLIHYYGLRANGEGIRKAYKSLIEAGEIVDTVVLNCMISSLFRAYEPQAAEQVYERMKLLHRNRLGAALPSRDYKIRREVTKALIKMADHAKRVPSELKRYQSQSIIAPDIYTYRILLQYLAVHVGDFPKVVKLLDEMRWFSVPLNGSIFLALFKGFAIHGGIRYTHWTQDRLESVWRAYMDAIDSQRENLYVGKWMILWSLKAFAKCAGKVRTLEVWEQVRDRWKPQDEELDVAKGVLGSLIGD